MLHYLRLAASLRLRRDDRGATAVEYGLMVTLIAVAIIGAVVIFSDQAVLLFSVPAGAINKIP